MKFFSKILPALLACAVLCLSTWRVSAQTPPTIAQAAAANPNPVLGNDGELTVLGADAQGEASLIYTWSALSEPEGASSPTFNPVGGGALDSNGSNPAKNSTAFYSMAGDYVLQVVIQNMAGLTATSTVPVTVSPVLSQLMITPAIHAVITNTTFAFTATGLDQFDGAFGSLPALSWSVTGGGAAGGGAAGGTIDNTGLFTAGAAPGGPYTVEAQAAQLPGQASGLSATATVFVAVPNEFPQVTLSASQQLLNLDLSVMVTDPNGLVTNVEFFENGLLLGLSQGQSADGQDYYNWNNPGPGVYVLFARAEDSDGGTVDSASVTNTVANATPPTIAQAAAANPNPVLGNDGELTVLGADAQGEATLGYTWSTLSKPPGAADPIFEDSIQDGIDDDNGGNHAKDSIVVFHLAGDYVFQVVVQNEFGLTATSSVPVTVLASPSGLTLTPFSRVVVTNTSFAFVATSVDQFNQPMAVQTPVTWTVNGGGTIDSNGLFTAGFFPGGPYTIQAQTVDSQGYIIFNRSLVYVALANEYPSVTLLGLTNGQVFSSLSDPFHGEVSFSPLIVDPDFVVTNVQYFANGQLLGQDPVGIAFPPPFFDWADPPPGAYTLIARTQENDGGTVDSPPVNIIAGFPPTVAQAATANPNPVDTGSANSLTVLGSDPTGESNLTYTWSAVFGPNGGVQPLFSPNGNNAAKNSTATYLHAGNYPLQVTIQNAIGLSVVGSVPVTAVTPNPILSQIVVTTVSHLVLTNASRAFSATVLDQFGDPLLPQPSLTWSVTGGGTIDNTGLFTAGADPGGPYLVQAQTGAVAGSTPIYVESPNQFPQLFFDSPTNGAVVSDPTNITLSVTLVDPDGVVTNVVVIENGFFLTNYASPPYSIVWTNPDPGSNVMNAYAAENNGNYAYAPALNFTVNPPTPPTVPAYSSYPSARVKIYLDFTGGYVPAWEEYNTSRSLYLPPYDMDGDPTTFSPVELEDIHQMWLRAAEAFSPFNVDVTTINPGEDHFAGPNDCVKVVIGGNNFDTNVAETGVAVPGGYSPYYYEDDGSTCYVFSGSFEELLNETTNQPSRILYEASYAHKIGWLIAHEAGHVFGLIHEHGPDPFWDFWNPYADPNPTNAIAEYGFGTWEYYGPSGGLITDVKCPIMGSQAVGLRSIWGVATTNFAPTQDDVAVIASTNLIMENIQGALIEGRIQDQSYTLLISNGFGFRPPDHGNGIGSADPLTVANNVISGSGVIQTLDDRDFFSFTTPGGLLSVAISPVVFTRPVNGGTSTNWGMLNVKAELFAGDGTRLFLADHEQTFDNEDTTETICTNLAAGNYYLAVESHGTYGDIGQYTINGTLVVPPPPPTITGMSLTLSGQFVFQFVGITNASYSVLTSANVALPLTNWVVLGQAMLSNGVFQFADPGASNSPARFYRVRSP